MTTFSFYNSINFANIPNRAEIFGEQLILDEDDNVVNTESKMLLVASKISVEQVTSLAKRHNGIAVAAHIDREENGMVAILGAVTEDFSIVELSPTATNGVQNYCQNKKIITNSDAHTLADIGKACGEIEAVERSVKGIMQALR